MVAPKEEGKEAALRRVVVALAVVVVAAAFAVGRHAALCARAARRVASAPSGASAAVHDQHVDERSLSHSLDLRGRHHGQPGTRKCVFSLIGRKRGCLFLLFCLLLRGSRVSFFFSFLLLNLPPPLSFFFFLLFSF